MNPRQFGPYQLVSVLGEGGMGVVYRAEPLAGGAPVALKTVRIPDEVYLQSLRREIRALARLRHPGIVRILDEGVEDGLPWYSMELLSGRPLREFRNELIGLGASAQALSSGSRITSATADFSTDSLVEEAPMFTALGYSLQRPVLPPAAMLAALPRILRLVGQLCSTLGFLHGEGVVYRDLKPSNILVREDDVPVIVDFGITAELWGSFRKESLSFSGSRSGTAYFMAPEQIRGQMVDARADLYALGCLIYDLLTGAPPFLGIKEENVFRAHLEQAPLPPSAFVPGLPAALDALVLKLLAKEPRERFGYAGDVLLALGRLPGLEEIPALGPLGRSYLYRPNFEGRRREFGRLRERIERLRQGAGGILFIAGESGIGKTRILLEAAALASKSGVQVLVGESLPPQEEGAQPPLSSLRQPLQQIVVRSHAWPPGQLSSLLGQHGRILANYEPALASALGEAPIDPALLPPSVAQFRVFLGLEELFSSLSERMPLLVLLDDLQWVDELTVGFLQHALERGLFLRRPILVVGTFRSEELHEPLVSMLGDVERLSLGRLEEQEIEALVGDMLAWPEPPRAFTRLLTRQSEGNPFFVAEFLQSALEEGILNRDPGGQWRILERQASGIQDWERLRLPRTVHALIHGRIEALSPEARQLARIASVVGREIKLAFLEELSPDSPLQVLLQRQILEEHRPGEVRFVHDKIREVTYAGIEQAMLAGLHERVALALERRLPEVSLGELAFHWEQSGKLDKARAWYLVAARQARDRHVHTDAERFYRAYLALMPQPTPESVLVRSEFAEQTLELQGRLEEAEAERLMAWAESTQLAALRRS